MAIDLPSAVIHSLTLPSVGAGVVLRSHVCRDGSGIAMIVSRGRWLNTLAIVDPACRYDNEAAFRLKGGDVMY